MTPTATVRAVDNAPPLMKGQERNLRKKRNDVSSVDGSVYQIVPDLEIAIVNSDVGDIQLHLPARLCPVPLHEMRVGQKLTVSLKGVLALRILQVSLAET
ncbi:hypothetical protein [Noviherbaspirillum pedocola]|uniref:Uncharacterized protein n=1 Tax=Noviherbaspirillum pedocola TaxID=2801341 RepID=A0A934SV23_9BURK|nr:hypothetical protein [Noviherbaspirillum pedocola]MBK4736114.1 hypothetical protein [Noviherbaspirillum pedocola]